MTTKQSKQNNQTLLYGRLLQNTRTNPENLLKI